MTRRDRDLQALGLLLLLGRSSSSTTRAPAPWKYPTSIPELPSSPSSGKLDKIPGVQVYVEPSEAELTTPPDRESSDDALWRMYAIDSKRAGPKPTEAEWDPKQPHTRKMTAFERWALEPYFQGMDYIFESVVHNGLEPLEATAAGIVLPKATVAFTHPVSREIYVLHGVKPLWQRWWLALLAHELVHVHQMKMGMTLKEALIAILDHGYVDSPIEVMARHTQRRVLRGLTMRARSYYRNETK
jgi:hypothetical protein